MPNNLKEALKQDKNIQFFKWFSILLLSVALLILILILVNTGVYQKEIIYLSGLLIIPLALIIATEFSSVKVGNMEFKKFKEEFNGKTNEILKEIKQTQIQIQNIKVTTIVNTGNNDNSSDAQGSREYSGRGNSAIEI